MTIHGVVRFLVSLVLAIQLSQCQAQLSLAQTAQTTNDLVYVLGANYKMYIAAYWRYLISPCSSLSAKLNGDVTSGFLKTYCPYLTQCPVVSSRQSCMVQQTALAIRKVCCKEVSCSYGTVFPSERIIGGQPAQRGEFPWTVMILIDGNFTCAGVIVDQLHAVTSAHCLGIVQNYQTMEILAGRHQYDLKIYEDGNQRVKVKSYLKHELYDAYNIANDIAIMTLATPLNFNFYVTPACLPPSGEILEQVCTVAGWGTTNLKFSSPPAVLMKVELNTYNRTNCLATFKDTSKPPGDLAHYLSEGTMCATNGLLGGKDSCFGDSGGPLMCIRRSADMDRYFLYGLVSNSADCAKPGEPGIYTSISYYADWIQSKLILS